MIREALKFGDAESESKESVELDEFEDHAAAWKGENLRFEGDYNNRCHNYINLYTYQNENAYARTKNFEKVFNDVYSNNLYELSADDKKKVIAVYEAEESQNPTKKMRFNRILCATVIFLHLKVKAYIDPKVFCEKMGIRPKKFNQYCNALSQHESGLQERSSSESYRLCLSKQIDLLRSQKEALFAKKGAEMYRICPRTKKTVQEQPMQAAEGLLLRVKPEFAKLSQTKWLQDLQNGKSPRVVVASILFYTLKANHLEPTCKILFSQILDVSTSSLQRVCSEITRSLAGAAEDEKPMLRVLMSEKISL